MPGEDVGGLFGLEPVSEVPDIVIDLHSDAGIEHERGHPFFGCNAGRAGARTPGRRLRRLPLAFELIDIGEVILGIGMMLRF